VNILKIVARRNEDKVSFYSIPNNVIILGAINHKTEKTLIRDF